MRYEYRNGIKWEIMSIEEYRAKHGIRQLSPQERLIEMMKGLDEPHRNDPTDAWCYYPDSEVRYA